MLEKMHVCFPFKGRLNRSQFWLKSVLLAIPAGIVTLLVEKITEGVLGQAKPGAVEMAATYGLVLTLAFVQSWMALSLWVRRAHDHGWGGRRLWLMLVPGVNFYAFYKLLFAPGEPGANAFGEPPEVG